MAIDKNFIEICFVDLGNTSNYDYYKISDMNDLNEAYRDFKADDVELQSISHNQFITDNIREICELLLEEDVELNDIINVLNACGSMEQTREVILNSSYMYVDGFNKREAFITYIDELDYLRDVPEHLVSYIDYDKLMRDFEFDGLIIDNTSLDEYIFIY